MSAAAQWVLGIDTCGPSGSVALAQVCGESLEIAGQTTLAARTYSATLIAAVRELLAARSIGVRHLAWVVVVRGPGSFTGVRVGLSAAKGLAEGAGRRLIAVTRLEVLTTKSGVPAAALDAHRQEVFLRIGKKEMLAAASDLSAIGSPNQVAVCDPGAEVLLQSAWPRAELVSCEPPMAGDALRLALPRILAGEAEDVALLDGHYLRRSDAEIFGPQPA